ISENYGLADKLKIGRSSSAPRIVNAWSFAVGMVASEIRPCEGCGSRCRRLRTRRPHSRSDTGPGHQEFEWLSYMPAAIDRPTTPEEITIGGPKCGGSNVRYDT